jgi:hypothetical protein
VPSQLKATELAAVVRMKLRRVSVGLLFMALLPRLGLFRRAASASIVCAFHYCTSLTIAAGGCNPDMEFSPPLFWRLARDLLAPDRNPHPSISSHLKRRLSSFTILNLAGLI